MEKVLVAACIEYLNLHGHFVWRNNTGLFKNFYKTKFGEQRISVARAGMIGSPDIIGVHKDGRFLGVECKVGRNKLSPHQLLFQREIRERGGISIIAYSLDDLKDL